MDVSAWDALKKRRKKLQKTAFFWEKCLSGRFPFRCAAIADPEIEEFGVPRRASVGMESEGRDGIPR
ncbi:hypothetical protein [Agrobacterium sp.]|uniref:hypothetical protein n=1 Tax=Agrobacterium sp. TaxID=361 RepID=UPI00289D45E7|nr:hypothetical protein [Agrobacterium sp.]